MTFKDYKEKIKVLEGALSDAQNKLNIANNTVGRQIYENKYLNDRISHLTDFAIGFEKTIKNKDAVIEYLENRGNCNDTRAS